MSSGDGKRTVPDVITAFHYIPEKHVLCAATSLTCRKSDVSVVTFAYSYIYFGRFVTKCVFG